MKRGESSSISKHGAEARFWKRAALATWAVFAVFMSSVIFIKTNDEMFGLLLQVSIETKEPTPKKAKVTNLSSSSQPAHVNRTIQRKRRTKLHVCYEPTRNQHGYDILKDEFGFVDVDAYVGEEWDVIFGGYPYCGFFKNDYKMESGLNKMLLNEGFNTLQPHQVYHPCMGCTATYCNKEQLCRLQRQIDPESCYLLPEDRKVLVKKMKQQPNATWVLKHDSSVSAVHSGKGVQLIESAWELPPKSELETDRYLVQPFVESYLGPGDWRRKTEVRYYVAITSITPLRAYYFNDQWMPLSSTLWLDHPPSEFYKRCQQDSHAYNARCARGGVTTPVEGEKRVRFSDYQTATGMPKKLAKSFHKQAIHTMTKIFELSHGVMRNHTINQGITSSGASCFSFMRADFGISPEGKPFLYEINELPYGKEPAIAGEIQMQAYRDLFHMIGLADRPVPAQDRAAYEAKHRGGWRLLSTFESDA